MKYIIAFLLLSFSIPCFAQIPPAIQDQAQGRLEKVGGSEEEVRKRLLARGINPDKVDMKNPQEVIQLQTALEQIEKELASEQKAKTEDTKEGTNSKTKIDDELNEKVAEVASSTTQDIVESVEEGATIEEAIAEEIIDAVEDEQVPAVIYGQHIFRDKEIIVYRDADEINASDSYILNTGDKIAVSIWGISELDAVYDLNQEGFIKPQGVTRINLKGLELGKAKELLYSRFSNYYRFNRNQFAVTVTYPRTITVNIVGEVLNQGSFTLPAINTAFNALAGAGGPSDIGSVRNIKIIRKGGEVKEMDIYEFLLDPSVAKQFYLEDGDYIHVGVAERTIKISGSVRKPYIYELKPTENLKDLVKYAGGLPPNAYQSNIQVKRYNNDMVKIIDVNYRELVEINRDFQLISGDEIVIGNIPLPYQNYVGINGSVDLPSNYELESGMKISNLIEKGVLSEGSRTDVAYLARTSDDGTVKYIRVSIDNALNGIEDLELLPKDQLIVLTKKNFVDSYTIAIQGAVRNPNTFKYNQGDNLRIEDLVLLSGGLKEDATDIAYVYRKDLTQSKEQEYVRINIKNALENPESGDNLILKPNDRVQIFSVFDYKDEYVISISGAVRTPSSFEYDPSEKLRVEDVVILSGGLRKDATDFAYIYRTRPTNTREKEYIRIDLKNAMENPSSADNMILEPNDQLQILSKLTYIDEFTIKVSGEVRNPGAYQYHPSLNLKDVLTLSGGLKLTASSNRIDVFRMVLNQNEPTKSVVATVEVDENLEMVTQTDFKLEPFDQIVVRPIPEFELQQFVTIEGEVKYPGSYALLDNNEKLTTLLERSGGLTVEAFPEGATLYRQEGGTGFVVLRLDEALKNKKDRHNFILKEGDVLTIPKNRDLVSITGATKAIEIYPDNIAKAGKINVAFKSGKRAKWYVDQYAAGVGTEGRKKLITVEHPNGEIKRTKNFLFFKVYPKVRKGSVVKVGVKPPKPPKPQGENQREKIDWGRVLADSVTQATAILTLVILVQRVN